MIDKLPHSDDPVVTCECGERFTELATLAEHRRDCLEANGPTVADGHPRPAWQATITHPGP